MTPATIARRSISDPIAADHDLGQQIGRLDIEIAFRVADLHELNARIVKLREQRQRLVNRRLDLIPEIQDVELLRARSRTPRGMGR
jgi:hypothetical protein